MQDENEFWSNGSFAQSMSKEDKKNKMRTFHMKHDEEMDYNCRKCNTKTSAYNKEWHNFMCGDCFNNIYFNDN